jgi:hypothetical protein
MAWRGPECGRERDLIEAGLNDAAATMLGDGEIPRRP